MILDFITVGFIYNEFYILRLHAFYQHEFQTLLTSCNLDIKDVILVLELPFMRLETNYGAALACGLPQ